MSRFNIRNLYYITHIDNLPSVLQRGILSHKTLLQKQVQTKTIYDGNIVNRRSTKTTLSGLAK
ncbi:DarT ssDNA thymidine ADP-ribosyltransferase family protein [Roseofilum casamattae]|uniref:DarT ssDNA thymidine ADP-ribosyltransferase family protein n=1 Tax=Roseofilum casamattae TaxID=3082944 RepID=UPI003D2F570B